MHLFLQDLSSTGCLKLQSTKKFFQSLHKSRIPLPPFVNLRALSNQTTSYLGPEVGMNLEKPRHRLNEHTCPFLSFSENLPFNHRRYKLVTTTCLKCTCHTQKRSIGAAHHASLFGRYNVKACPRKGHGRQRGTSCRRQIGRAIGDAPIVLCLFWPLATLVAGNMLDS